MERTRSSKWPAGHGHSEPTSWLPSSAVTPHVPSEPHHLPCSVFLLCLPFCHIYSIYLLAVTPLLLLLNTLCTYHHPQVSELWDSAHYSFQLQFDFHLNSALSLWKVVHFVGLPAAFPWWQFFIFVNPTFMLLKGKLKCSRLFIH